MANRSLSWIEPQAAADLLSRLARPPQPAAPQTTRWQSLFPQAEESVPSLRLDAARGTLERVQMLCEWASKSFDASSVFLADEHGLLIHGLRASADDVVMMAPLLAAMQEVTRMGGASATRGAVSLREGEVLHWAEATSSRGRLCIGMVLRERIAESALTCVQAELSKTLEDRNA